MILDISYEKWELSNGLKVLIHEDHSDPIVQVHVSYHVGSNRESAGKSGKPLTDAPLPGEIGKWILENVDEEQWNAWIGQGTKVINELRLDFSREEDQKTYEDYMIEFLGIPQDVIAKDKELVD